MDFGQFRQFRKALDFVFFQKKMASHFFGYYATFWLTDRPSVDPVTIRPREGAQNGQKLSKNSLKPRRPVNSCRNQKVPLGKVDRKANLYRNVYGCTVGDAKITF